MILNCFALYDSKSNYFTTPFFFHYQGQAIRACIDLGSDPNTTIGRHPADYVLFRIGTFDDQNGVLERCMPENLGPVASFLRQQDVLPLMQAEMNGRVSHPEA